MANFPLDELPPCEFQPGDRIKCINRSSMFYSFKGTVNEAKKHQMASNDNWYWLVWCDVYDPDLGETNRMGLSPEEIQKVKPRKADQGQMRILK